MLFFFNDTATTEIYTLSLHDALPIYSRPRRRQRDRPQTAETGKETGGTPRPLWGTKPAKRRSQRRSEEHTSELQSRLHLVCRLLLEKKQAIRTDQADEAQRGQQLPAD